MLGSALRPEAKRQVATALHESHAGLWNIGRHKRGCTLWYLVLLALGLPQSRFEPSASR